MGKTYVAFREQSYRLMIPSWLCLKPLEMTVEVCWKKGCFKLGDGSGQFMEGVRLGVESVGTLSVVLARLLLRCGLRSFGER